jgi:hypothetical protein
MSSRINFVVHDRRTGEVLRTGFCQPGMVEAQADGHCAVATEIYHEPVIHDPSGAAHLAQNKHIVDVVMHDAEDALRSGEPLDIEGARDG